MGTIYVCMELPQMLERLQHYHPNADTDLVSRAYKFAEEKHAGQTRLSGEPYFVHPVYVASILTEIGIDEELLPMTFKASKDIRDKYVLSRLAWDLGILDEIAEDLL